MIKMTKLAVDIPKASMVRFTKAVKDVGSTKRYTVTKMIDDFVLNMEANPTYFSRYTENGKRKKTNGKREIV